MQNFLKVFLFSISICFAAPAPALTGDELSEGAYLVRAAGCTDCHSVSQDERFAGGLELGSPFGTFRTPNITPDVKTGIGSWTFENFKKALREGVSPDGQLYYPTFPYRSYTRITDSDLRKMWDYLRSVPAIEKRNLSHSISFPFDQRWLLYFWQAVFFRAPMGNASEDLLQAQGAFRPDVLKSKVWNRGAYLVEGLFHCAECHTPRDPLGGLTTSLWMSGSDIAIGGRMPPNITPDVRTGRGTWRRGDWLRFLSSGVNREGKSPAGEMADVIQNTSALSSEDLVAMTEYLMSLEPVSREQK